MAGVMSLQPKRVCNIFGSVTAVRLMSPNQSINQSSIHPSIHFLYLLNPSVGSRGGGLEPIPAVPNHLIRALYRMMCWSVCHPLCDNQNKAEQFRQKHKLDRCNLWNSNKDAHQAEVQQKSCLYDVCSKLYHDLTKKDTAQKGIEEKCSLLC